MLLGDLITRFSDQAVAEEAVLALGDLTMLALLREEADVPDFHEELLAERESVRMSSRLESVRRSEAGAVGAAAGSLSSRRTRAAKRSGSTSSRTDAQWLRSPI